MYFDGHDHGDEGWGQITKQPGVCKTKSGDV